MKPTAPYFALIAFIVLILSNCKREKVCQDNVVIEQHIADSLRDKVPHTGYDTLIFFNQYGDTVFLIGKGSKKYINKYKHLDSRFSTEPDCAALVHYFTDIEELSYSQDKGLSNTTARLFIHSLLIGAEQNGNSSSLIVSFPITKEYVFVAYWWMLDDRYYTKYVTIGNKTYKCLAFNDAGVLPNSRVTDLFFNHTEGILRVIENDTIIWDRKL
jgi:hypothetical protein